MNAHAVRRTFPCSCVVRIGCCRIVLRFLKVTFNFPLLLRPDCVPRENPLEQQRRFERTSGVVLHVHVYVVGQNPRGSTSHGTYM